MGYYGLFYRTDPTEPVELWGSPHYTDNPRISWGNATYVRCHDNLPGWMTNKREAEKVLRWFKARYPEYHSELRCYTSEEWAEYEWHRREEGRFDDGTYEKVPWHAEPWANKHPHHYAHMSLEQVGRIAYTPDAAKGRLDRQVVMNPGRYLNRFFGDVIDAKEIERWAQATVISAEGLKLHFTQDADEIERIYVGGPDSCMRYELSYWDAGVHPTRVYAGPDLALAYLGDIDDGVKSRAVVWPEKKLYTRAYGDVTRMELLLEAEGYTKGSLKGARLQRIVARNIGANYLVVPYVDRADDEDHGADDDGTHLTLIGGGAATYRVSTLQTCGYSSTRYRRPPTAEEQAEAARLEAERREARIAAERERAERIRREAEDRQRYVEYVNQTRGAIQREATAVELRAADDVARLIYGGWDTNITGTITAAPSTATAINTAHQQVTMPPTSRMRSQQFRDYLLRYGESEYRNWSWHLSGHPCSECDRLERIAAERYGVTIIDADENADAIPF